MTTVEGPVADGRCGNCKKPLGDDGQSELFCDDLCQQFWHEARAIPLTGYREPLQAGGWAVRDGDALDAEARRAAALTDEGLRAAGVQADDADDRDDWTDIPRAMLVMGRNARIVPLDSDGQPMPDDPNVARDADGNARYCPCGCGNPVLTDQADEVDALEAAIAFARGTGGNLGPDGEQLAPRIADALALPEHQRGRPFNQGREYEWRHGAGLVEVEPEPSVARGVQVLQRILSAVAGRVEAGELSGSVPLSELVDGVTPGMQQAGQAVAQFTTQIGPDLLSALGLPDELVAQFTRRDTGDDRIEPFEQTACAATESQEV